MKKTKNVGLAQWGNPLLLTPLMQVKKVDKIVGINFLCIIYCINYALAVID